MVKRCCADLGIDQEIKLAVNKDAIEQQIAIGRDHGEPLILLIDPGATDYVLTGFVKRLWRETGDIYLAQMPIIIYHEQGAFADLRGRANSAIIEKWAVLEQPPTDKLRDATSRALRALW
jgi:hypothetical protein